MPSAIIRIIWATHRGKAFPDRPARDKWLKEKFGSDLEIVLCEAPENPHELYSAVTESLGEVLDRKLSFDGFELGVQDMNLLCWLALLKQSGAILAPIWSPAFQVERHELQLVDTFSPRKCAEANFSGYFNVAGVEPWATQRIGSS